MDITVEEVDKSNVDATIETLVDRYSLNTKKLAYSYVKDWGIAEDITQEVFITSYKKIHEFREECSYKSWLYRITVNKCKDFLRGNKFNPYTIIQSLKHNFKNNEISAEEKLILESDEFELSNKVLSLPVKYREVIILYYYEEFKIHEISELTGINTETIKTRLRRAKQILKKEYEGK